MIHPDYKFDLMYSKRAFVHWYVGEGMEEVSYYLRHPCLLLIVFPRVNSRKLVRISLPSKRTTRKSAPTLLTSKTRPNTKRSNNAEKSRPKCYFLSCLPNWSLIYDTTLSVVPLDSISDLHISSIPVVYFFTVSYFAIAFQMVNLA